MYCPRCGTAQAIGSRRCDRCGTPFTCRESLRGGNSWQVAEQAAPDDHRTRERGPGVGTRLLRWLVTLLVLAVIIMAAVFLWSGPIQTYLERLFPTESSERIVPQASSPAPAPELAPGEQRVVLTQEDLSAQLAQRAEQLGLPADSTVEITPQGLVVETVAYGMEGRYIGQVEAQNGQVVVTGGEPEGPLGWVVSADQVESALNDGIRRALAQNGVAVTGVTLEQGRMTLDIARR
jgi:hypothetical protein